MAEDLWVNVTYKKRDDGKFACTLTSNAPFERGVSYFDMKAYVSGLGRIHNSQFAIAPEGTIHVDVYFNGGEGTGVINADFKATSQAIEVVASREIKASVSQE